MFVDTQKGCPRRRKGRPLAKTPRSKAISVRLTSEEYQMVQSRAGSSSMANYARNTLLHSEEVTLFGNGDRVEAWRIVDQLTDSIVRIDEAFVDQHRLVEDEVRHIVLQLLDALDDLRIQMTVSGRAA